MQPLYVQLKGFKGFRDGLGLEEVAIDFSNLPTGLIAVVGKNGRGKTTLLDNLHPYRIMPYKLRNAKEWTTGSFNFYDQCYGRDALKEFTFAFNGSQYRSVVLIDAERRKQEAYLYRLSDDGSWVSYNDAVKDGKTGAYDQAIEELLGSPSLFFSSRFRSQDARKLSSYPRSEILGIICELLDVDHVKEQGEKAAKVVTALTNLAGDLERQKAPILALLDSRESLGEGRVATIARIAEQGEVVKDLKDSLAGVEKQVRELELSNASQTLTRKRVEELRLRHDALKSEIDQQNDSLVMATADHSQVVSQIDNDLAQLVAGLQHDLEVVAAEADQDRTAADQDRDAIAGKRESLASLLARADQINEASSRAIELEKEIAADRSQFDTLRAVQGGLETSVSGLISMVDGIDATINQESDQFAQDSANLTSENDRESSQGEKDLEEIAARQQMVGAILSRATEINAAVAAEKELTVQLEADRQKLEEMRAEATNLRVKAAGLASVDNELQSAQSRLEGLNSLTSGLKGLDCHGDGKNVVNKSCKLLAAAVEAEKQIPAVEREIKELLAKQVEAGGLVAKLTSLTKTGTEQAAKVKQIELDLEEVRLVAILAPELATAADRVKELTEQAATLRVRLEQRLTEISNKLQTVKERAEAKQSELSLQKADAETKLAEAQDQLAKNHASVDFFSAQIAESEADLMETRIVAALLPELASASTRLSELDEQDRVITERLDQRLADHTRKSSDIAVRIKEQQQSSCAKKVDAEKRWDAAKTAIDNKLKALATEADDAGEDVRKLEATLNGDVDREIATLNHDIEAKRIEIEASENDLKNLHAVLGSIDGQIDDIQKKADGLVRLDAEIAKINAEMVNWKILAKACSNDGIVALELDDAGPSIAAEANKLLYACYGSRFSVRLETQGIKADGDWKEIFDITVFDAEYDTIKSLRDMSGGEVTYIEDAITRAFCQYNLNQSGKVYATLYSDEKDGALDEERKRDFFTIKREALAVGSHDREFFITQTVEMSEKADARIILEAGRVHIS